MIFLLKNDRYINNELVKKGIYETKEPEIMEELKESAKRWNDVIVNYKPLINKESFLRKMKKPALVEILENAEVDFEETAETDELIKLITDYNLDFDISEKQDKKELKKKEELKEKEAELKAKEDDLKKNAEDKKIGANK